MRLDYFAGMRRLLIAATAKTPQIEWNDEQSTLTLSGRSIPENAVEFYRPVLDWTHCLEADTPMTVMVQLASIPAAASACSTCSSGWKPVRRFRSNGIRCRR